VADPSLILFVAYNTKRLKLKYGAKDEGALTGSNIIAVSTLFPLLENTRYHARDSAREPLKNFAR
jgi:hypothetical protein